MRAFVVVRDSTLAWRFVTVALKLIESINCAYDYLVSVHVRLVVQDFASKKC